MPTAKLGTYTVNFLNSEEYHSLKNEVFTQNTYYWESSNAAPFILDLGAHIGLATLYFKKLYPAARIVAVEPHPTTFEVLEQNVWENQLEGITTVNAAVSPDSGTTLLHADTENQWWSTASQHAGAWTGTQKTTAIRVTTVTLAELITQSVDLLKMDIEGSELAVLSSRAAQAKFNLVQHLFIEFHPHQGQKLSDLLTLLHHHFPHVATWQHGKPVSPTKAQGLVLIEGSRQPL